MITAINGYVLKCEECKRKREHVEFDIQFTYLWANGYGTEIRIWCYCCGATHDVRLMKSETEPVIKKHTMRAKVSEKYHRPPMTEWEAVSQELDELPF